LQGLAEQYQNEQPAENSETIVRPFLPIKTPIDDDTSEKIETAPKNTQTRLIIIICLIIFLIVVILGGAIVGPKFYLAGI